MPEYRMVRRPDGRRVMEEVPHPEPVQGRAQRRMQDLLSQQASREYDGGRRLQLELELELELETPLPEAPAAPVEEVEEVEEDRLEVEEDRLEVEEDRLEVAEARLDQLEARLEVEEQERPEPLRCPVAGCGGGPFGSQRGLEAHVRAKHKPLSAVEG